MTIIQYLLALIFIASGSAKLFGLDFELQAFERWGYPLWFMYLTGLLEVVGGLAIAANILRKFAALGVTVLMIGAIGTHVLHQEWPMLAVASSIFIMGVVYTRHLWKAEGKSPTES